MDSDLREKKKKCGIMDKNVSIWLCEYILLLGKYYFWLYIWIDL